MQHAIQLENLGPQGPAMAQAIDQCVHCGFCLSACPTYKVLGEEMDSPRGRIFLMKEALEGNLSVDEVSPYVDRCLGCLACVTACPSGVAYGDLLTPYRSLAESQRSRTPMERSTRMLVRQTLPYPDRFRQAVRAGKLGRSLRGVVARRAGRHDRSAARIVARSAALAGILSGGGRPAGTGSAVGRLCAAGVGPADQLGDAARAWPATALKW